MTRRRQQVESTLKRAISNVLARKLADPRIAGLVSVTRVQVDPGLRQALVFVSVMPAKYERRALHGLHSAAGRVRSLIRRAVALRTLPRIEFRLDESVKQQDAVFDAIQRGLERDAAAAHDDVSNPAANANNLQGQAHPAEPAASRPSVQTPNATDPETRAP